MLLSMDVPFESAFRHSLRPTGVIHSIESVETTNVVAPSLIIYLTKAISVADVLLKFLLSSWRDFDGGEGERESPRAIAVSDVTISISFSELHSTPILRGQDRFGNDFHFFLFARLPLSSLARTVKFSIVHQAGVCGMHEKKNEKLGTFRIDEKKRMRSCRKSPA